ncbi:hypothetical protein [Nocardia otitidiscaviarum]|nr:hypothetical protein [Nocardia otitidiscaviarum]
MSPAREAGELFDGPNGPARTGSRWPALTEALKLKGCPLRPYLAQRFPLRKPIFEQYKETAAGPLVVPGDPSMGGGTGAVGGAFDHLVRFLVDPQPELFLPATGALRFGGRMPTALVELATSLGVSRSPFDAPVVTTRFEGPRAPSAQDPEVLARGCWALSYLTELGRGIPPERSPLAQFDPRTVSGDDLFGLASSAALDQLAALRTQAEKVLLPALASRPGVWAVGPTFEGSALMNADADLIAAGTLVEIKTVLGSKRKDGSRYAVLDAPMLFQMVGYTLLDFHDDFAIREVALFNARYGHLAVWDLQALLDSLAGCPVDLSTLRADFAHFLHKG